MSRDQQAIRGEIEVPILVMLRGVADEETSTRAEGKLMGVVAERLG
jgi:hypothetical protein